MGPKPGAKAVEIVRLDDLPGYSGKAGHTVGAVKNESGGLVLIAGEP